MHNFENLRIGQVVNTETMQALADSISYISLEISILKQNEANFRQDNGKLAKSITEEKTHSKQQCQTKACVLDNSNNLSICETINACKNNGSINKPLLDEMLSGKNERKQGTSCFHDNTSKQIQENISLPIIIGHSPTGELDDNCPL